MMEEIFGFRQRKLLENGLTVEDTGILNGIIECVDEKKEIKAINGKIFYLITYNDFYNKALLFKGKKDKLIEKFNHMSFLFEFKDLNNESFLISFNKEMMLNILMKDRIKPDDLKEYDKEEIRKEIDLMLDKMDLVDLIGMRIYARQTTNRD